MWCSYDDTILFSIKLFFLSKLNVQVNGNITDTQITADTYTHGRKSEYILPWSRSLTYMHFYIYLPQKTFKFKHVCRINHTKEHRPFYEIFRVKSKNASKSKTIINFWRSFINAFLYSSRGPYKPVAVIVFSYNLLNR